MDPSNEYSLLQFQSFASTVNVSFWFELARRKLDQYRLSEDPIPLYGQYSFGTNVTTDDSDVSLPSQFYLEGESFGEPQNTKTPNVFINGTLYNTNTAESFAQLDKKMIFDKTANQIWKDITSGAALKDGTLLARFLLVTYADIKKYKFYYWFAFPALNFDQPITAKASVPLATCWPEEHVTQLKDLHTSQNSPAFFLVSRKGGSVQLGSLTEWETLGGGEGDNEVYLAFVDPCSLPSHPGWPLRNLLMLVAYQWKVKEIKVICYRHSTSSDSSILLHVKFPEGYTDQLAQLANGQQPKSLGWEKNSKGQVAPRYVNLSATMDPVKLASSSVDLNLKLMQWRLLPSLNLEKISSTKCLLLGAGTLGCNVARALMSWGVRNMTLVDNGNVSFSNPVRQSLFEFEDCLHGGKPKAEAAANRLKAIFPGINAVGTNLSIPMPGHAVGSGEVNNAKNAVETLQKLIESHDVVFVLMDSRESRWLPTLLCAVAGKLVINTALGFDSYLVMRHGLGTQADGSYSPKLGCYFCNDVVAPQNSLRDRTLDQQCTVTRPGLSSVASALATELMVALLHHPQGGHAIADSSRDVSQPATTPLGLIPHSIRGFLTHFANILVEGKAYDRCTGCSPRVVEEYTKNGFDFLLKVFNNPTYLEDLTGLTQMKEESESIEWEVDEEDDF